jgi:hypothetical protein
MRLKRGEFPGAQVRELADGNRSSTEIAFLLNLPSSRSVESYLRLNNLPRRSPGSPEGKNSPFWSGGRLIDRDGYVLLRKPKHPFARKSGYILEHRLMLEQKIGRYLQPGEVVDHIDGNKLNNKPENLRLFQTNADHLKETLKGCIPNWSDEGKKNFVGRNGAVTKVVHTHNLKKKSGAIRKQQILHAHEQLETFSASSLEMERCTSEKQGLALHEIKQSQNPECQELQRRLVRYKRKHLP